MEGTGGALSGARTCTDLQDVLVGVSGRIQSQWADLLRYLPSERDESIRYGSWQWTWVKSNEFAV